MRNRNTQRHCKTVAKVYGTWYTKNDAHTLFFVDTRNNKMTLKKVLNKCFYFQTQCYHDIMSCVMELYITIYHMS